ncbi:KH domain-containing, RNA-binding, signal transduction-associated protein 3 [Liparis tanakae]|uniref:KH domain-containing, RNA-binding, signal transduction-associated protein 3 n=1 Tax=Liparis tanakae TaxID=230148 RepID=A0A4Z2HMV9_9TELE|nr:KH domain-containing, RNA-binding, signal transduction-associated protein 3 [Liparis tanakae]
MNAVGNNDDRLQQNLAGDDTGTGGTGRLASAGLALFARSGPASMLRVSGVLGAFGALNPASGEVLPALTDGRTDGLIATSRRSPYAAARNWSSDDYYEYGQSEESYDSYGLEEWPNSRAKAPPARSTKGVYRDQPYTRY